MASYMSRSTPFGTERRNFRRVIKTQSFGTKSMYSSPFKRALVNNDQVSDARLKILQKTKAESERTVLFSSKNQKTADARMKIEERKKQQTQIPAPSVKVTSILKNAGDFCVTKINNGMLQRSVGNSHSADVQVQHVMDSDMENDNLSDEDTEMKDLSASSNDGARVTICRTIVNDLALNSKPPSYSNSVLRTSAKTVNKAKDFDMPMPIRRTIDNDMRRPARRPVAAQRKKPEPAKRVVVEKKKPLREKPRTPITSRLGKKIDEVDGYRVFVSNLHSDVTGADIKELFEDLGQMLLARIIKPGTAEVIYKDQEGALKAIDMYHNRQLDGQPMKCIMVKPSKLTNQQPASKKQTLRRGKNVPRNTISDNSSVGSRTGSEDSS